MKMYCFRVRIADKTCMYYTEALRLDKAIQDLCAFANACCFYDSRMKVCSVYETYRLYGDVKVSSRFYGLRRKVPAILDVIHSSEFFLDVDGSLSLKDFIAYARSLNGY